MRTYRVAYPVIQIHETTIEVDEETVMQEIGLAAGDPIDEGCWEAAITNLALDYVHEPNVIYKSAWDDPGLYEKLEAADVYNTFRDLTRLNIIEGGKK